LPHDGSHLVNQAPRSALGVNPQRQAGLSWVGLNVPMGRLDAEAMAELARLARCHGSGELRFTEAQNVLIVDVPAERLEAQAKVFDDAIATGAFELVRGGLDGYLAIMRRADCDDAWRARATKALDGALPGLPYDLRVLYLVSLADAHASRGRADEARAALDRADGVMASAGFLPEDIVPIGVPIAVARAGLGDRDAARAALRSLRSRFEARRDEVVNLRRATSWRALASAYVGLGDRADAEACFVAALEDGALNPNARPRAEDLCMTMLAMARCGFVPTEAMDRRIEAIRAGLIDPW